MATVSIEKSILMPMQWDGLDDYREEYNQMLLDKATNGNGIVQEKFITISVRKKDVDWHPEAQRLPHSDHGKPCGVHAL